MSTSFETLQLPTTLTPRAVVLRLAAAFAPLEGTTLLYSGDNGDAADRSLLFLLPYERIEVHGDRAVRLLGDGSVVERIDETNPWDALRQLLGEGGGAAVPEWVGYLSYEMGATADRTVRTPYVAGRHPDAYFQRCALCAVFNHRTGAATVHIATPPDGALEMEAAEIYASLKEVSGWFAVLEDCPDSAPFTPDLQVAVPLETIEGYSAKVEAAKKLIYAGDIYQVNVSQRCVVKGEADPYALFATLAALNPAPFSGYLNLPGQAIVSSSPERFLRRTGDHLETRPIKGTAPRGRNPEEDALQKMALLGSEKDRAELMMITDLMRNDLGKVSAIGTVEVPELLRCETYANVFHLVSIVRSIVEEGLHSLDVLRAAFPGGSITGCPKLRAMQVIGALERRRRGLYTGAIGWLAGNGDFDFNIAIRTLVQDDQGIEIQLGGAIVADSDPIAEYEETLAKGASIFKVLGIDVDAVCGAAVRSF